MNPMETAPRDGTKIILLVGGSHIEGWYGDLSDCDSEDGKGRGWKFATLPSHGCGCCYARSPDPDGWCPLPD